MKKVLPVIIFLFCFGIFAYSDDNEAGKYLMSGDIKLNSGDYAGAVSDYTAAIALDPNYAIAYNKRGLARYGLGDYGGAVADYNKALALDPNHVSSYNNRGNARFKLGDKTGAMQDYTRAIELDPECSQAYYNRGTIEDKYGDHFSAAADKARASRINAENAASNTTSAMQAAPQAVTQNAAIADLQKMNNDIQTFQAALTGCWDSASGIRYCYNQDGTCSEGGVKTNAAWKIISVNTLSGSFLLATGSAGRKTYSYAKFVGNYGEMVIYASRSDMQVGGNGRVFYKETSAQ
jgi:tetratricopeptide (TPR) repeat protein